MELINTQKRKISQFVRWFFALSIKKKVISLVILLLILWFGIKPLIFKKENKVEYITSTAEKGTLISSISASGTVTSANNASITTSASGVVSEVHFKNGDTVTKGDTIAILTPDTASQQKQAAAWASYLGAQNSLNSAKAQMNSLQSALFRANQAFVNGKGTQDPDMNDPVYIEQRADWQQAEANYTNQQGVIAAAEASLTSAWLSYTQNSSTIIAPISGTLSNLNLTPGQTIAAASSNSNSDTSTESYGSITLTDGKPQATVNLSEIDVIKVKQGQKVTMTLDAFTDKTFTGRVASINTNGSVSSGVTTYPATITFDTTVENMYPNMSLSATIITNIKNDVLLVPSSAVSTINGESTVRVMKDGKVNNVPVTTGDQNDTQIEITSGLSEGDSVVTGQTGGATTVTGGGASTGGSNRLFQSASPFGGGGSTRSVGTFNVVGGTTIRR